MTYSFNPAQTGEATPETAVPVPEAPVIVDAPVEIKKNEIKEDDVILIPEVEVNLGVETAGPISELIGKSAASLISILHAMVTFEDGTVNRKKEVRDLATALRNEMLVVLNDLKGIRPLIMEKKNDLLDNIGDERLYLKKESLVKRMAKLKEEMAAIEEREALLLAQLPSEGTESIPELIA